MYLSPILLQEAKRHFFHSLKLKKNGPRKFSGSAAEICEQVIEACWNPKDKYFQQSPGHFCQFWTRDFGMCAGSLVKLGHRDRVIKTLEYALSRFLMQKRISTALTPHGRVFDFPTYAVDSLPFLVHSLRVADSPELFKVYRGFIESQVRLFFNKVVDKSSGHVKKNAHFSSMRDYAVRNSSCYDNVMLAMLKHDLTALKLFNPLSEYRYFNSIRFNYWTGSYFLDDLSGSRHIAGDANIFPFWTGLYDSKEMLSSSLDSLQKEGLDTPYPLKYTSSSSKGQKMIMIERFVSDWENDSCWAQMAPIYISLVKKADNKRADALIRSYTSLIEKHGTYFELYDKDGDPYTSLFYHADEGMLWAAIFLELIR